MALTIRLSDEEKENLAMLMGLFDKKTASATIKALINQYFSIANELSRKKEELKLLKLENDIQQKTLRQVKSTFKMLCDLKE